MASAQGQSSSSSSEMRDMQAEEYKKIRPYVGSTIMDWAGASDQQLNRMYAPPPPPKPVYQEPSVQQGKNIHGMMRGGGGAFAAARQEARAAAQAQYEQDLADWEIATADYATKYGPAEMDGTDYVLNPFENSPLFTSLPTNEEMAVQMTPEEAETLRMMQESITTRSPQQKARDALLMDMMGAGVDPQRKSLLDAAIAATNRPLQQQLEQQQLENEAMFSRYGQINQESSPFARETNRLFNEGQQLQADVAARLALPWAEGAANRALEAASLQRDVEQTDWDRTVANLEAQALPRLIEQYGVDEGQRMFNDRLNMLLEMAAIAMTGSQPVLGSFSESSGGGGGVSVGSA